jgi:3-deoxy-D-manno-octulosonate 8-phosphate phosphatase (KDO 8-P phosphatase)
MNPPADLVLFAFDYDGVFTDGRVWLLPGGIEARSAHIRDGYAVVRAIEAGLHVAIISGGSDEGVRDRMLRLGVTAVHLGVKDKAAALDRVRTEAGLSWSQTAYCGDDLPDLPAVQAAGWSSCPADAVEEIKQAVHAVGTAAGGAGYVREVLESALRARGIWQAG